MNVLCWVQSSLICHVHHITWCHTSNNKAAWTQFQCYWSSGLAGLSYSDHLCALICPILVVPAVEGRRPPESWAIRSFTRMFVITTVGGTG